MNTETAQAHAARENATKVVIHFSWTVACGGARGRYLLCVYLSSRKRRSRGCSEERRWECCKPPVVIISWSFRKSQSRPFSLPWPEAIASRPRKGRTILNFCRPHQTLVRDQGGQSKGKIRAVAKRIEYLFKSHSGHSLGSPLFREAGITCISCPAKAFPSCDPLLVADIGFFAWFAWGKDVSLYPGSSAMTY